MLLATYSAIFATLALVGWIVFPVIERASDRYTTTRAKQAQEALADIFMNLSLGRLKAVFLLTPMIGAALGWFSSFHPLGAAIGFALGMFIPRVYINFMRKRRIRQFEKMLIDSLLLLSSCLRAGLSMLQGFQVIVEEMSPPINQEMGLLLKEMRMGVNFEDAIRHFQDRNPIEETNLFVTAVLVARETGGDVTNIFTQLVETMRERKKIKEKIKTLTFMSKAQGLLMALLPLGFLAYTYTINKQHMEFFLADPFGQLVMAGVVLAQIIGTLLFIRFSKSPL